MAKSLKTSAKQAAAKGAAGVSSVASDALAAGAVAAAGVVLSRVAEALGSGSKKVEQSAPAVQTAIGKAVPPAPKGAKLARTANRNQIHKGGTGKKRTMKARPARKSKARSTARRNLRSAKNRTQRPR